MKTQAWLVSAASWTIVGTLSLGAWAAKPVAAKPATPAAADPAAPADPAAKPADPAKPPAPVVEEEGPYAPKGKTGKLKEEAVEDVPVDAAAKPKPLPKKPGIVGLDWVIGFGKMSSVQAPAIGASTTSLSFILGGGYDVGKNIFLGMRVPFSTASFKPEQQPSESGTAFGNIELAGRYNNALGEHTNLPVELALAFPTATGDFFAKTDPARIRNHASNDAAQASRGLEEDALFAPHRMGFVPRTGLAYDNDAIHTDVFLKIPILVRTGGQPPDQPNLNNNFAPPKRHNVVIETVLGGEFFYDIIGNNVDLGLRAWWTQVWIEPFSVGAGNGFPKTQIAIEPGAHLKVGQIRGGLGFIWPIGGRVGGDFAMKGIRISAGYVF